jgi:hypothetical protein
MAFGHDLPGSSTISTGRVGLGWLTGDSSRRAARVRQADSKDRECRSRLSRGPLGIIESKPPRFHNLGESVAEFSQLN